MIKQIEFDLIRSKRKSVSVEIRRDATVLVRAPQGMPVSEIKQFVTDRSKWIEEHVALMKERTANEEPVPQLTCDEIKELADKALKAVPERVRHFAQIMGVTYGRITIRNQKTRWGSCSARGNLNFNCLLMLMPDEIVDYVVVHELAHRKEMNHSAAFWSIVESVLPDYRGREKWLKENGSRYMRMQEHR